MSKVIDRWNTFSHFGKGLIVVFGLIVALLITVIFI